MIQFFFSMKNWVSSMAQQVGDAVALDAPASRVSYICFLSKKKPSRNFYLKP